MSRPSSKDAILDAVEQIVADRGAAHVTLDAVAQECGISKGGVMYNYPTKEALIQALLQRFMSRFDELRSEARARMAGRNPSELEVEIDATLAPPDRGVRVHAGLLAVIANDPSLLEYLRETVRGRFRDLTAGFENPDDAGLLFFAAFGLHFHDVLGLSLITPRQRKRLAERLLDLARGGTPLPAAEPTVTKRRARPLKTKGKTQ